MSVFTVCHNLRDSTRAVFFLTLDKDRFDILFCEHPRVELNRTNLSLDLSYQNLTKCFKIELIYLMHSFLLRILLLLTLLCDVDWQSNGPLSDVRIMKGGNCC